MRLIYIIYDDRTEDKACIYEIGRTESPDEAAQMGRKAREQMSPYDQKKSNIYTCIYQVDETIKLEDFNPEQDEDDGYKLV